MERAPVIRLGAWLLLFALPATAQELPAFFDVTGVAQDDVLNIRARPDARSDILDTLAPDAQNIEVVRLSENGRWALVNTYDQAGWAARAYLAPQLRADFNTQPLTCFGTEPFWSATLDERLTYAPMDGPAFDYPVATRIRATNRTDRYALEGGDKVQGATAVIERRACSDGMSEAQFGLSINLLVRSATQNFMLSGCCRLNR